MDLVGVFAYIGFSRCTTNGSTNSFSSNKKPIGATTRHYRLTGYKQLVTYIFSTFQYGMKHLLIQYKFLFGDKKARTQLTQVIGKLRF